MGTDYKLNANWMYIDQLDCQTSVDAGVKSICMCNYEMYNAETSHARTRCAILHTVCVLFADWYIVVKQHKLQIHCMELTGKHIPFSCIIILSI